MLAPLKEVVELLVAERYDELAARSPSVEAADLRAWMEGFSSVPLGIPPDEHYEGAEVFPLEEPPPRWRVWIDLWDAEEGDIADLHAIVFLREVVPGVFSAELKEVLP
jgi:hypothetical protein